MDKIDFIKQDKQYYTSKTDQPEIVEVPEMQYLMVDGRGMPEDNPEFQRAMGALYGVAYTIKFMPKKGTAPTGYRDFKVAPPEGLWWMADDKEFDMARPNDWCWTLMIRMPDFVTGQVVEAAISEVSLRKKDDVYKQVRLEILNEGRSVQIMHIGPYDQEQADLDKMTALAKGEGFDYHGKHHEIYFGDPRRTAPEKLKTLLRHPLKPAASPAS